LENVLITGAPDGASGEIGTSEYTGAACKLLDPGGGAVTGAATGGGAPITGAATGGPTTVVDGGGGIVEIGPLYPGGGASTGGGASPGQRNSRCPEGSIRGNCQLAQPAKSTHAIANGK
jgi:hypothetical protein